MAKTRRKNRQQHTSKTHEATFTNRELIFISWLLVQKEGLGREETRYVSNIVRALDLDRELRFKPAELEIEVTTELSGYELNWMKTRMDEIYKENKMPPNQAVPAIDLDEYLTELLQGVEDTPIVEVSEDEEVAQGET